MDFFGLSGNGGSDLVGISKSNREHIGRWWNNCL